jgi:hypothetical protein
MFSGHLRRISEAIRNLPVSLKSSVFSVVEARMKMCG